MGSTFRLESPIIKECITPRQNPGLQNAWMFSPQGTAGMTRQRLPRAYASRDGSTHGLASRRGGADRVVVEGICDRVRCQRSLGVAFLLPGLPHASAGNRRHGECIYRVQRRVAEGGTATVIAV